MEQRIEAWRQAFEHDDNAVVPTLTTFAWNHAVFMSVVKAVELAPVDAEGNKPLNFSVLNLLRSSYWGGAILSIRRLVDPNPLNGPRGVSSLRSILNDVSACRRRITRRVYVETIAGLQYDEEDVDRRYWEYLLGQPPGVAVWVPPELHVEPISQRHDEFDFLSGIARDARTPEDLIDANVFERLEARLARVDAIAEHATVYFAHASTKESREGRELASFGPNDAMEALQILVETAELIGRWFLYRGVGDVLATPQFDQFENLDKPLLADNQVEELRTQWDTFAERTALWPQINHSNL
jgi:hypothetical protein